MPKKIPLIIKSPPVGEPAPYKSFEQLQEEDRIKEKDRLEEIRLQEIRKALTGGNDPIINRLSGSVLLGLPYDYNILVSHEYSHQGFNISLRLWYSIMRRLYHFQDSSAFKSRIDSCRMYLAGESSRINTSTSCSYRDNNLTIIHPSFHGEEDVKIVLGFHNTLSQDRFSFRERIDQSLRHSGDIFADALESLLGDGYLEAKEVFRYAFNNPIADLYLSLVFNDKSITEVHILNHYPSNILSSVGDIVISANNNAPRMGICPKVMPYTLSEEEKAKYKSLSEEFADESTTEKTKGISDRKDSSLDDRKDDQPDSDSSNNFFELFVDKFTKLFRGDK